LIELGQITPGFPVNIDGHNIKTYSRKEMKLSFIAKVRKIWQSYSHFLYSGPSVKEASDGYGNLPRNFCFSGDSQIDQSDKGYFG